MVKHIVMSALLLISLSVSAQNTGLELGSRWSNMGYLIYNGQILRCDRDMLAQKVHIYLKQPAEARIMILQNTQSGTVSVFVRHNTGAWKIVTCNTLGMLPTITSTATNQYRIYWGDVYDRTVTFNY